MLFWIIQITLISILFIFLVHHLFTFLKTTLTVPKVKDLVNSPNQKYKSIFNTLSQTSDTTHVSYTNIDLLPSESADENSMKDELKSFLKKQLNSKNGEVMALDNYLPSYTNY